MTLIINKVIVNEIITVVTEHELMCTK